MGNGMEPASVFKRKEAGREKTGGQNGIGLGQRNGMKRDTLAARCNPAYELNELIKRPFPVRYERD